MDLTKAFDRCRGPLTIKKLSGTGVPLNRFTAFLRLGEFAACTDTAAWHNFRTCALMARIIHWPNFYAYFVFHGKPITFIILLTKGGRRRKTDLTACLTSTCDPMERPEYPAWNLAIADLWKLTVMYLAPSSYNFLMYLTITDGWHV